MRNIQVIDGAENCVYDIFAAMEEEFALIFHPVRMWPSSARSSLTWAWPEPPI